MSLNQHNTSAGELLDEPTLVATIHTGQERLLSVACLNDDKIWTIGQTNAIKCFNIKGVLLQTIKQTSGNFPDDIAIDMDGDLFYISGTTLTVNKVKKGQRKVLIRLEGWVPLNLCVTSTGDLLVTMFSDDKTKSKVVRYSGCTEKKRFNMTKKVNPCIQGILQLNTSVRIETMTSA